MPQLYDTLTYAGAEKKLADWGFSLESCDGTRNVMRPDTWQGTVVDLTAMGDPFAVFEGQIIVRAGRTSSTDTGDVNTFSGGTIKFQGKRLSVGYGGSSSGPTAKYVFQGPWYDLDKTQYLQLYKGQTVFFQPGEIILFSSTNNPTHALLYPITCGDMIQAVLQWLLDQYAAQGMAAPFQYKGRTLSGGAIDLTYTTVAMGGDSLNRLYSFAVDGATTIDAALFNLYLPSYIAKPMTCAQVIQKALELSPRTNVAFDYTTVPPTLQVRSVDNFPSASYPLYDGVSHKSFALTKREDLMARATVITYRILDTIAGNQVIDYKLDKWGPNGASSGLDPSTGLRVVADTVDLQGFNEGVSTGHLDCEPLACIGGTTATKRAWWASRRGGEQAKLVDSRVRFQKVTIASLSITAATNASPIAITTSGSHGMSTGNQAVISGALGNTAANGIWVVTVTGGSTFTLNGSAGSGAYTGSGVAACVTSAAASIPDATMTYATTDGTSDSFGAPRIAGNPVSSADLALLVNRLVRGTFHSWMKLGSTPVQAIKVRATSKMQYSVYDAVVAGDTIGQLPVAESTADLDVATGNVLERLNGHDQHFDFEITNGTTGDYATISSFTQGESYIIGAGGIAQYLFNALNKPQYEGEYVRIEADFTAGVSPLARLNLTGGRAEWATMDAQIQSVRESYGTHETYVSVGPAKHLSAAQLSSMLNMWRFRRAWYNPAMRTDNTQLGSGSDVDMARTAGSANTKEGVKSPQSVVAVDYNTPGDPTSGPRVIISLDTSIPS